MDKKDIWDDKDNVNLTKIANLLKNIPVEKRQPFVDLIKDYLKDER